MRITKLKLENVAGLYVGSGLSEIEIDFTKSKNKITLIQSQNGKGKSVLISTLNPFAGTTSLDERSSLPFIREGKNGYKEIWFQKARDEIVIKHYFKATKESHSVKSYFSLNGIELNENGNVSSFLTLVDNHFNITPEMMRLIRLGTNVNSFISLSPTKRKEYIGKLIEEIELYLKIYKKIADDIRVVKVLLQSNSTNLYNSHISDITLEMNKLSELNSNVKSYERERDSYLVRIDKIKELEKNNSVEELTRKKHEVESALRELAELELQILKYDLSNSTLDSLIQERSLLLESKINTQANINSYRLSMDSTLKNIERIRNTINKISSNNDVQSLLVALDNVREVIKSTPQIVTSFKHECSSEEIYKLIAKLSSYNQISTMIIGLGNKPLKCYLELVRKGDNVERFLKDQAKKRLAKLNDSDLSTLMNQLFERDFIIMPNCDNEFKTCPYYRISNTILEIRNRTEPEYDDETLRYIQVISNNLSSMFNDLDGYSLIKLPDNLMNSLRETTILNRLDMKLPSFDLSEFHEYLSLVRASELYKQNLETLRQYEERLTLYRNSGIDSQIEEIKLLEKDLTVFNSSIENLSKSLEKSNDDMKDVEHRITILSKYLDSIKYKNVMENNLESIIKILKPLESSTNERIELTHQLRSLDNNINICREEIRKLDNRINEFNRLTQEAAILSKKHKDLNIIMESVSTRKGIPVVYMQTYLGKIQKLANDLLAIIYEDDLILGRFQVTQDVFEIPYIKNGVLIPDVRYASQSELSLVTMALSFALSTRASKNYNILLLDEIDAGLDDKNRLSFMTMLERQMQELNAEQVFMISHNLASMSNIPVDAIRLDDSIPKSKLQNTIYE